MKRALIPFLALLVASPPARIRGEELRKVTAVRYWSAERRHPRGDRESTANLNSAPSAPTIQSGSSSMSRAHVPRIGGHRFYSANVADRLVKKVRVAETQTGVTRIVLDLQSNADYSATQLSNPDRLVVELRPVGQTSRLASPFAGSRTRLS